MGNLKEVAYDVFQPSIEEQQENIDPNEPSKVKAEKLFTPENIKQGRPITIESVRIDFPLKPYPAQVQMMSKIVHSLRRKENAVLESPTGSGKSLALLCATLAWRQKEENLAIEKLTKERQQQNPPVEIVQESPNENNKREREEQNNDGSFDSDFQTQSRPEEKKPRYEESMDIEDTINAPRRRIHQSLQSENYPFSIQKFSLKNHLNDISNNKSESSKSASSNNTPEALNPQKKPGKYEVYNKIPRIFVGSRTHKQLSQLVNELKENTTYRPRMTILGSREQLCIHPKVSKSSTKTDDCNALLDKKACTYSINTRRLLGHSSLKTDKRVWDIEDLIKMGRGSKGCPYYAARKMYEGAEVIFCPYNYIIDPIIRSTLDIQLKNAIIIIDEAHNIEDASRSAGSYEVNENELKILSFELTQIIRDGFEPEAHNHMLYFIESLLEWISNKDNVYSIKEYEQHVNVWSGGELLQRLDELGIKATTFNDIIRPAYKRVSAHAAMIRKEAEENNIDDKPVDTPNGEVRIHRRKCVSNNGLTVLQALIMILGFFFEEGKSYSFDYRMALIKRIERGGNKRKNTKKKAKSTVSSGLVLDPSEWNYKLCFWCLNPGAIFRQLTEDTHSVILTSGTLSPMNTFESELETKFEAKLEANHVISPSQVWVGTIPIGPNQVSLKGTYNNIESFQYQDDLGEALYHILDTIPFGVLCFFPSYSTLEKLTGRWSLTGLMQRIEEKKLVLTEPRKSGKNDFEKVMRQYNTKISEVENDLSGDNQTGALLFGVFRGKISEGIDFTDNTCRAVVSIGIPYPGLKDVEVNLKKSYNDQKRALQPRSGVLSGSEWYATQAYRAINQALGRCIRHRNDWGAIILLEERFQYADNIQRLSKWIRSQHQTYSNFNNAIDNLSQFAARHRNHDADARKELVTNSVNHFFKEETKTEEIKVETTVKSQFFKTDEAPKDFAFTASSSSKTVLNSVNESSNQAVFVNSTTVTQSVVTDSHTPIEPKEITVIISDDEDDNAITENHQTTRNETVKTNTANENSDDDDEIDFSFDDDFDFDKLPDTQAQQQHINGSVAAIQTMTEDINIQVTPPPFASSASTVPVNTPHTSAFKPPLSKPEISKNNITPQQVVELITCVQCNKNLLSGFAKDRRTIPNDYPLALISFYSNSASHLIELNKPGSWIIQDNNLVGGPLGANLLSNRYFSEVDRNDMLCFRTLKCKCSINNILGVVICDALDGGNKEYVGKVYLWNEAVGITTRKPMVVQHNRTELDTENDFNISSQRTNMNDMFYNLP